MGLLRRVYQKQANPDYKPADWFINRRPVYKPVRFTMGSQHIHHATVIKNTNSVNYKTNASMLSAFTILPIEMGGRDVYDTLNISLVPWEWPENQISTWWCLPNTRGGQVMV